MTKNDEIKKLVQKAEHNIKVAKKQFNDECYDIAVSRAYYAMFYCAEALLLTKDLRFSKHSAVHSAFGHYFAKTGEVNPELHRMLIKGDTARDKADYEHMIETTKEEAEMLLKDAEYFVSEIKQKLEEYLK